MGLWPRLDVALHPHEHRGLARLAPPGPTRAITTLRLHAVQLSANALWSILFFGQRRPDLALMEIGALWTLLVIIQFRLFRQDRPAALLWRPYLAWVTFATALNTAIWWLN